MVLKTTSSHEEGCDRFWGINTKEFLGDENGELRAIKVSEVSWELDVMGRPIKFAEVEDSEREIPCQRIFLAMGFLNPQFEGALQQLKIGLDDRKNVKAKEGVYRTNIGKGFRRWRYAPGAVPGGLGHIRRPRGRAQGR